MNVKRKEELVLMQSLLRGEQARLSTMRMSLPNQDSSFAATLEAQNSILLRVIVDVNDKVNNGE